jgi:hypothetical protein
MCNRSDASKLIIHYKSWLKSQMPGSSVFLPIAIGIRSSDQFVEEYWPTSKEVYIHNNNSHE